MIDKLAVAQTIEKHGDGCHNLARQGSRIAAGPVRDRHGRVWFVPAGDAEYGIGEKRYPLVTTADVRGTAVGIRITQSSCVGKRD